MANVRLFGKLLFLGRKRISVDDSSISAGDLSTNRKTHLISVKKNICIYL